MDQLTGAEPYNVFNDFVQILKDFYGRSPYKMVSADIQFPKKINKTLRAADTEIIHQAKLYDDFNDFVQIMKDFYGYSPYKTFVILHHGCQRGT